MSDRARAYQAQISGLEPGLAVRLPSRSDAPNRDPNVYFDGCREFDDRATMLDAKGEGYLEMLVNKPFFFKAKILEDLSDQAKRQLTAANGRAIEWHFAEKPVADFVREQFEKKGLDITIRWTPPRPGRAE